MTGRAYTRRDRGWSAEGLRRLLNDLNARYPGGVDVVAHSMGNVVTAGALGTQSQFPKPGVVATYVASQAAVSAHTFNNTLPNRTLRPACGIFNLLARYPGGLPAQPSCFSGIEKAARERASFFNEQDPAMLPWGVGQALKPDRDQALQGQQYVRTRAPMRILQMPRDQYEIFCHCDPSPAKPLGAQRDAGGMFDDAAQVDLGTLGFTGSRADHSGQFYDAFSKRAGYWRALLRAIGDPSASSDTVN